MDTTGSEKEVSVFPKCPLYMVYALEFDKRSNCDIFEITNVFIYLSICQSYDRFDPE